MPINNDVNVRQLCFMLRVELYSIILNTHGLLFLADKLKGSVKLYFQQPQQLLDIFTDLEDENLKLIQECREEEGNLEKIRNSVREVCT